MSWQQLKRSKMLFVLVGGLLVGGCSSTGTEPSAVNHVTPTASSPANTQEKGLTTCAVAPEYATTKPTFSLATSGCPMAHCSPDMSDRVSIAPPRSSQVQTLWQDQAPIGSSFGLGCSSNGSIVVCSYANADDPGVDTVVAYNASGQRLWSSGNCMGRLALGSAPLIGQDGSVIAASEGYMVRFDANGKVIWRTTLPEGLPISPVVTSSGVILIAASGQGAAASSPLSTYDSQTGAALGELCVKENPTDANCFDTINTPGVEGNRAYISMAKPDADNVGWLVAVDIDRNHPTQVLTKAWHFAFGGPSGASPLVQNGVVYFDGSGLNPGDDGQPHLFAVTEQNVNGSLQPQLLWSKNDINGNVQASFAVDPRGGFWSFGVGSGTLERRSMTTGAILTSLNVTSLLGQRGTYSPSSAITIAGPASQPVMLVGAIAAQSVAIPFRRSWVMAIDLNTSGLLWKVRVDNSDHQLDFTSTQFAVTQASNPIVVFSSQLQGARAIGLP